MRIQTEKLPNDYAAFHCQRRTQTPPDFRCGRETTIAVTMNAWQLPGVRENMRLRAICSECLEELQALHDEIERLLKLEEEV